MARSFRHLPQSDTHTGTKSTPTLYLTQLKHLQNKKTKPYHQHLDACVPRAVKASQLSPHFTSNHFRTFRHFAHCHHHDCVSSGSGWMYLLNKLLRKPSQLLSGKKSGIKSSLRHRYSLTHSLSPYVCKHDKMCMRCEIECCEKRLHCIQLINFGLSCSAKLLRFSFPISLT